MKKLFYTLTLAVAAIILVSCGNNKKPTVPDAKFASYISAYTGGVISTTGKIQIEMTTSHDGVEAGAEVKENLFSFSPSIKGKAYWVNSTTVEFIPQEGALKSGKLYQATFRLGKVQKVSKDFEKFDFSFRTRSQDFEVSLDAGMITFDKPDVMSQAGTIAFGDMVDAQIVMKMLSLDGSKPGSIEPSTGKASSFRFTFDGIKRGENDQTLSLKVNGSPAGIDRKDETSIEVPAVNTFRLLRVMQLAEQEHGMVVSFTEPLEQGQDLNGLITVDKTKDLVFQIDNNNVKVLFDAPGSGSIDVVIHEGIRSAGGKRITETRTVSLSQTGEKPQVEITSTGNIMPDSKNLLLRFRAASLSAIDLKVVKIYESNVLMFLQTNKLDESEQLRRSAREIYNKSVYLTGSTIHSSDGWQDYSIDLAPIIKQEPGAIYRVTLSFKREYSTYQCGEKLSTVDVKAEGMIQLTPEMDDQDSSWDEPEAYYYDSDEDYDYDDNYNWSDRNDPCKPSYYMNSDYRATCNILASNLGVIVKSGADRKVKVVVTDILSTDPVADADVKVYNYQLQVIGEGKTNGQGMADIDVKGVGFATVVQKDGWKSYVKMVDSEQNSLSRFDVGGKQIQKGLKGYIYGERGVWRPGDTLHMTFVMEDRFKKVPDHHPVSFELYNPRGQFHTRQVNASGMNGFYRFDIPTSPDDPTGAWTAYVKIGGATFQKNVRIEAIKPNRLKINFNVPNNRIDGSGQTIPASLEVAWLTGATARNLKATVEMTLYKGSASPFKGYEKFNFLNPATDFASERSEVYNGRIDENGKATVSLKSPDARNVPGMMRADILTRVFEPGGDASIYVQSFPYSPYSRYVGINTSAAQGSSYLETDRDQNFDIVTLNAAGQPVDSQVDYKIYKLRWSWWWQSGGESLSSYVNGDYKDPVAKGTVNTAMGRGQVTLRINYPDWGRYLIYLTDKTSGHSTGAVVYVDWPSSYSRSTRENPDGASMLTFSMDKPSYEVGEMATVTIPECAGGRALLSFENGSAVLDTKWVDVAQKGDTKYSFRITPEMAPNFYLHISLLQPHAQTVNSLPIRLYGVQPVSVNNKASQLEPVITAPDVLRPQTEFTVKVAEKQGREMTYTLAVVDDGLLDLTNFKTPNPWSEFYAREALGVRTWDMYDYVIGAFGGKMGPMLSIGGDEQLKGSDSKANRFKPVVKFLGPFTLKKGATDSHKITLPMYIGSVRVMVVAGANLAYGSADKTIPVRTPLMVLATLPRTVSVGEEILLPVNVFAMEPEIKNATVKVETTGGLALTKEKSLSISFAKPGDQMVYFHLKAPDAVGVATVKVTVSSGSQSSTDQIEIQVRNPNPPVITLTDTIINAKGTITLPYVLGGLGADNWVKMEVSRMPSIDVARRYDFLEHYEHLCSEQLTSCGFPMLYIDRFRDVDAKEAEKIKLGVQSIIKQLYGRQQSNGAFAYWPGYSESNDWVASYVGNFLWEASQRGYDVNQSVLSRWKEYQRRAAQSWSLPRGKDRYYYWYYQSDLVQAYRLYTLALAGSPEQGAMNRLSEMPDISVSAKWYLAAAYAVSGKKKAAEDVIAGIKNTSVDYTAYGSGYTYGSAERDQSIIVQTLVLMGNINEAMRQARVLSEQLSNSYYLSTQSTAFALVAMGTLASKMEAGQVEYSWSVDGKAQKDVATPKALCLSTVPIASKSGEVSITSRSKGSLFVSLVTKTYPLIDTLKPFARNINMQVSYTDMQGNALHTEEIGQGTDFRITVTVTNTSGMNDYTDMALTHIIPSGWEIFNDRMAVVEQDSQQQTGDDDNGYSSYVMSRSSTQVPQFSYQDIRDDRILTYFDLRRGETKRIVVRVQSAYVGRFILPAIQCEAMYNPTVRARSAAGWTVVK